MQRGSSFAWRAGPCWFYWATWSFESMLKFILNSVYKGFQNNLLGNQHKPRRLLFSCHAVTRPWPSKFGRIWKFEWMYGYIWTHTFLYEVWTCQINTSMTYKGIDNSREARMLKYTRVSVSFRLRTVKRF